MGYKKKGSKASLQASSVLAAILIFSGLLLGGKFAMLGAALALGEPTIFPFLLFLFSCKHTMSCPPPPPPGRYLTDP